MSLQTTQLRLGLGGCRLVTAICVCDGASPSAIDYGSVPCVAAWTVWDPTVELCEVVETGVSS